ncbi:hypothetical protein FALBO_2307 [Fusarium albosuccineum]|uniref:Uncharacterized protein n=1 Tax=Fusarium albosuccineum TaxID=1237068 RepID=A0A8H4LNR6_9HYPO|nr:hypothetical protein FALBO_2307 [Fusarium albosuccineum]
MTSETDDRVRHISEKLLPKYGFILLPDRQDMFKDIANCSLLNLDQEAKKALALQKQLLPRPSAQEFNQYKADYVAEGGREDDLPEGKVYKRQ